ncbi:NADH dehydrogenase (ubiquinone) 1 alpha [Acrasis kona]|uniref:Acyl carrier protein n=1 Tax=Acrasis kona TaxID=1008807 RepID=A0AAW2YWJ0_9EUKA
MPSFRNITTFARFTKCAVNGSIMRPSMITPMRYATAHSSEVVQPSGTFLNKDVVTERVLNVVRRYEKVDQSKLTAESNFYNDLGLDSLDTAEVVMEVENEFQLEIPDEEAFKLTSVNDCIQYVTSNPLAK